MPMKKYLRSISILAIIVTISFSCIHEETIEKSNADNDLQKIASILQIKNDTTNFVPKFAETYGYPLWEKAVRFPSGTFDIFSVPIKNKNTSKEIESIWFFLMRNDTAYYQVLSKRNIPQNTIKQTWAFDYFTQKALKRQPSNGLKFIEETYTKTIIETEHCNHIVSYANGQMYDHGYYCWTEYGLYVEDLLYYHSTDGSGGSGFVQVQQLLNKDYTKNG